MAKQPIRPDEAESMRQSIIPDEVIAVFDSLIVQNLRDGKAVISQDDAIAGIMLSMKIDRATVFAMSYLDVEDLYREAGWIVEYDKPGYNESYPATFTFRSKR